MSQSTQMLVFMLVFFFVGVFLACRLARCSVRTTLWFVVAIVLMIVLSITAGPFIQAHLPSVHLNPPVLAAPHTPQGSQATPPDYREMARRDALDEGLDPNVFIRQIELESHFDPHARGQAGELGIAQFTHQTATSLHIDPLDPVQALKAASHLMATYRREYGDYAKALAAYNAGEPAVNGAIAKGGTQWRFYLPSTTNAYIQAILG